MAAVAEPMAIDTASSDDNVAEATLAADAAPSTAPPAAAVSEAATALPVPPPAVACVVQVLNISPTATEAQLQQLFANIGPISRFRGGVSDPSLVGGAAARSCLVRYYNVDDARVACLLNNTMLLDRALLVTPASAAIAQPVLVEPLMPGPPRALLPGIAPASGLLPAPLPGAPPLTTAGGAAPRQPSASMTAANGNNAPSATGVIPAYLSPQHKASLLTGTNLPILPPLPAGLDAVKMEEMRRTMHVGNIANHATEEDIRYFFSNFGEISYIKLVTIEGQPARFAFIEFKELLGAYASLMAASQILLDRPIK
ncbi:hypothetical protein CAOG_000431 [Capsaspora owczarzaki ATCC 30864]|uniref:RRM domain-containing protein n=2 Tax=Capsaspora owczarzaki (strain ATCC 30864) TaxID=595528 RepID=A0A0D2WH37_CAPO3|nr:hypothetical protein CAOG_000431 [Capsaspora owczarzaki ATCC 30864]